MKNGYTLKDVLIGFILLAISGAIALVLFTTLHKM